MVEVHWNLMIPSTLTCRVESNTYVKSRQNSTVSNGIVKTIKFIIKTLSSHPRTTQGKTNPWVILMTGVCATQSLCSLGIPA